MVIYKEKADLQRAWPWWRLIMTGLISLALFLSAVMSWHYLAGGPMIGCGGGSPCEQVLSSHWSAIAGILPVSGLAMGAYLAMLVASLFIGPGTEAQIRRLAWGIILILTGSVAGSAIWFTIIQKWVIGNFCPYCMTTHITGLLLTALVIWRVVTDSQVSTFRIFPALGLSFSGLVLAGILFAFQVSLKPSAIYREGESQKIMPAIDYQTAPMVGSPEAPYIVTLLFDYQCSHCQKMHFLLNEAIRIYSGKLAFVLCPSPLNASCNPYIPPGTDAFKNSCELARIGLAVWLSSREAFRVFEDWMFTFDSGDFWMPRSLETAMAKAIELVGQEKFDAAWADPWIGQYMQTSVMIFGQTLQSGKGGIPKMIYGSQWVTPQTNNAEDLVMILQNSLAVPMP